ncbi:MAG: metallophosphoesterase [Bacteroidales bacterium]|nr:metallophosphoesterase [Bacteroidales bacterium]
MWNNNYIKIKNLILLILALAFVSACSSNELSEDVPNEEYVRLHFSSDVTQASWSDINGDEDLVFNWEKRDVDSDEPKDLLLVVTNGSELIPSWDSPDLATESKSWSYSWLDIFPHEDDARYADFQTTRYYSQTDLKGAKYCFVLAGMREISEKVGSKKHFASVDMPSVFTQKKNQDPGFLSEYTYMYATAGYNPDRTSLSFNHIPAILRIIITNTTSESKKLQGVSFFVSDQSSAGGLAVASAGSDITFDWETGTAGLTYSEACHTSITTLFNGDDTSIEAGSKYTAYSMVLPLTDNEALRGKLLNFKIMADDSEYTANQFDAEMVAKANGGEICNWKGGNLYTITIDLAEEPKVKGKIIEDNDIEIYSEEPGTYTLRYEDSDGNILSEYDIISTLDVNEYARYNDLIYANSAPVEAGAIGIYDAEGNRAGGISVDGFKVSTGKPLYSIGMLSDVHCEANSKAEALSDFQNALTFLNARNIVMTCICGDITENGTAEELAMYRDIVSAYSPSIPVYTTTGNHDARQSGINEERWLEYTGQPVIFEKSMTLPDGGKDHFLFLGMYRWNRDVPYKSEHISWLKEKLEEYKNERCFVITHLFFPDRAGNLNYIYPVGNYLQGAQHDELAALCDKYTNSIWFSGHSHWKWELQKYQDRANIYRGFNEDGSPASGWCVHISSCANPGKSDGISLRDGDLLESEGAILHIYEDHVDMLGIDFKKGKYLPIASYTLKTSN